MSFGALNSNPTLKRVTQKTFLEKVGQNNERMETLIGFVHCVGFRVAGQVLLLTFLGSSFYVLGCRLWLRAAISC